MPIWCESITRFIDHQEAGHESIPLIASTHCHQVALSFVLVTLSTMDDCDRTVALSCRAKPFARLSSRAGRNEMTRRQISTETNSVQIRCWDYRCVVDHRHCCRLMTRKHDFYNTRLNDSDACRLNHHSLKGNLATQQQWSTMTC